jgi:hypothetical protein
VPAPGRGGRLVVVVVVVVVVPTIGPPPPCDRAVSGTTATSRGGGRSISNRDGIGHSPWRRCVAVGLPMKSRRRRRHHVEHQHGERATHQEGHLFAIPAPMPAQHVFNDDRNRPHHNHIIIDGVVVMME